MNHRRVDELHCDCNAQISSLNLFIVIRNFVKRSLYISVCSATLFLPIFSLATVVFLIASSGKHLMCNVLQSVHYELHKDKYLQCKFCSSIGGFLLNVSFNTYFI